MTQRGACRAGQGSGGLDCSCLLVSSPAERFPFTGAHLHSTPCSSSQRVLQRAEGSTQRRVPGECGEGRPRERPAAAPVASLLLSLPGKGCTPNTSCLSLVSPKAETESSIGCRAFLGDAREWESEMGRRRWGMRKSHLWALLRGPTWGGWAQSSRGLPRNTQDFPSIPFSSPTRSPDG